MLGWIKFSLKVSFPRSFNFLMWLLKIRNYLCGLHYSFLKNSWQYCTACGILVHHPRTEPVLPALAEQS